MRRAQRARLAGGIAAAACALAAVVSTHGCANVLNIDATRQVADAGTPGPDWSCLSGPGEEINPNASVHVTVVVMDGQQPSTSAGAIDGGSDLDTVMGAFLGGMTVRDCAIRDLACNAGTVSTVVTGDAGTAAFDVTEGFMGYFDIDGPGLLPTYLYPGQLLTGQSTVSFPAYAVTPAGFGLLAESIMADAGLSQTGDVGHLLATIYDCQDHQAPGVSISLSATGPDTVPFYFVEGLPSLSGVTTDPYGAGGAVNLPIGPVSVSARLPATPARPVMDVGMATVTIRPGTVTEAWIRARTR